jgi:hypothetical protein
MESAPRRTTIDISHWPCLPLPEFRPSSVGSCSLFVRCFSLMCKEAPQTFRRLAVPYPRKRAIGWAVAAAASGGRSCVIVWPQSAYSGERKQGGGDLEQGNYFGANREFIRRYRDFIRSSRELGAAKQTAAITVRRMGAAVPSGSKRDREYRISAQVGRACGRDARDEKYDWRFRRAAVAADRRGGGAVHLFGAWPSFLTLPFIPT